MSLQNLAIYGINQKQPRIKNFTLINAQSFSYKLKLMRTTRMLIFTVSM